MTTTHTDTDEWRFENVLPDDHFLSQYIEHGQELTDAYPEYHFGAGLGLLSLAANRNIRIWVEPNPMYPNIWPLLLGQSTVSRKSTALNLARNVLENTDLADKVLPEDFSPEALVKALEDDAQVMFLKDEFGEFLAKRERSYQSGVAELMSHLYGCPSSYDRQLRNEEFAIEDVYLTILGAGIPGQFAQYSSVADLESGFFPRLNIIWPERPKERKDIGIYKQETQHNIEALSGDLSMRYGFLETIVSETGEEIRAIPSEDGLNAFNEWSRKVEQYIVSSQHGDDFAPFFGRASNSVLKIACLIEFGSPEFQDYLFDEWSEISESSRISKISAFVDDVEDNDTNEQSESIEIRISEQSVKVAIFYMTKLFLPYSLKLLRFVESHDDQNEVRRIYDLAVKHADSDGKIQHSKLLRFANRNTREVKKCVKTLIEADLLEAMEIDNATYYRPIDDSDDVEFPDVEPPSDISFDLPTPEV